MKKKPLNFIKGKGVHIFVGDVHAPTRTEDIQVLESLKHVEVKINLEGDIMDTKTKKDDKAVKVDWERWEKDESFFKRHKDVIVVVVMFVLCIVGWSVVIFGGR